MRFGTTVAVMVLATGVIGGGATVMAVTPPAPHSKLEGSDDNPAKKPKAAMSVVPWKQVELKPEHSLLKGLVGKWTTNVHVFQGPYAKARDTVGTAEGKVLLGGLFVQVTQAETRMRQAYEGVTTYGYNGALGKYTADAIDTAGTAAIHFVGSYDAATKKLTMTTRYSDEKMKNLVIAKTVTTFIDDKLWTYEEFVSHAVDAKEMPTVAITYRR